MSASLVRRSLLALWCAGCVGVVSCAVELDDREGRECSASEPCGNGRMCINGACRNPGADGGAADGGPGGADAGGDAGQQVVACTGGAGCDDLNSCTLNDTCNNNICRGTAITCPPRGGCFTAAACSNGACVDTVDVGAACATGFCLTDGGCGFSYTYAPSNFTPTSDPGVSVLMGCSAQIDTSSTTVSICGTTVPASIQGSSLVLSLTHFDMDGGSQLQVIGSRPVIFAVYGDVNIRGQVILSPDGGAGGAGAGVQCAPGATSGGSFGGRGGGAATTVYGNPELVPLLGGCSGGGAGAGLGGGGLQISAGRMLTVNGGRILAGGGGGAGGAAAGSGGGSGGGVLLEGRTVALVGALVAANGGGGGGGGGDGTITQGPGGPGAPGGATAGGDGGTPGPAGIGGSAGGGGGAGGAQSAAAAAGGPGAGGTAGAGAGGGGVGRIRVNAGLACANSGTTFSPTPTGSGSGCP